MYYICRGRATSPAAEQWTPLLATAAVARLIFEQQSTMSYDDRQCLHNTQANQNQLQLASEAWRSLKEEALRRGWHGRITLTAQVQDGTIQQIASSANRRQRH